MGRPIDRTGAFFKKTGSFFFGDDGKEQICMTGFDYTLTNPMGLHMRPAGVMVKRLGGVPCEVTLHCGQRSANAKGLFSVMALAAKCGETVTVEVTGENEQAVAEELQIFFKENF